MHGQYPGLSDPNKQNFFLPTHHSRKLRHLRDQVLKVHQLTGVEGACTPEHVELPQLVPLQKKVTKEELKYNEAYRGRNIDPFSSVSGAVSFNLFLPPVTGPSSHQGLLCEGVWWDVPKSKRRVKPKDEIHLPSLPATKRKSDSKSFMDEYLSHRISSIERNTNNLTPSQMEPKVLQYNPMTALKVHYLDKENIPHSLPLKDRDKKISHFSSGSSPVNKENVGTMSKLSVLPPIFKDNSSDSSKQVKENIAIESLELCNNTDENSASDVNFETNSKETLQAMAEDQIKPVETHRDDNQKSEVTCATQHTKGTKMKHKYSSYNRSIDRIRKNLRNSKNIMLVDKWIDILESTEFLPIPKLNVGDFFGQQRKAPPQLHRSNPIERLHTHAPSNIDVMNFFDKPTSDILKFDQLRSLNRQTQVMKLTNYSNDKISDSSQDVLPPHVPQMKDNTTLSSLLAIQGLNHLLEKSIRPTERKYLLHKAPKRLLISRVSTQCEPDKRARTLEKSGYLEDKQQQLADYVPLPPISNVITEEPAEDELINTVENTEEMDTDLQSNILAREVITVQSKAESSTTKKVTKSVFHMSLPDNVIVPPHSIDLKGKMLVSSKQNEVMNDSFTNIDSDQLNSETAQLKDQLKVLPPPILARKCEGAAEKKHSHKTPEQNSSPADVSTIIDSHKEPLLNKEQIEALPKIKREKRKPDKLDNAPPAKKNAKVKGEKMEAEHSKNTPAVTKDATNKLDEKPPSKKLERAPRITILADGSKDKLKVGKYIYPNNRREKGPTIKGYSTCLIEGGSVTYRHTIIPEPIKTSNIDEATGKFAFMRRKNKNRLRLRGKGKSVKKINPLLKYGIPQGKLPEAMLLMTIDDLPPGQQLHYLSKEQLDAIKEKMKDQFPDIPPEAWDDPEVLVSLLPSLINSGAVDLATLLQFSDEVLIAALGKCDIDALLERPDIMNDPRLYKRIMAEKLAREAGLTGAAKERLREYIEKNMEVFMDPSGKGFIPVIPPSVGKLIEMMQNGSELKNMSESEIIEALAKLDNEYGKESVGIHDKMVYDPKTKKMIRLDSATIACNGPNGVNLLSNTCSARKRQMKRKDQREKRRKMRELEEAQIIIERREGETSAEFKKREKKERKEIMKKRRREARLREEQEIVIERREGETSAEFRRREKRERRAIMRQRELAEIFGDEEDIVVERLPGETSADFKKREKKLRKEYRKKREKEYDDEMKLRWERKQQRRADRKMRRERGEVVSSSSDDDSSIERWQRWRKGKKKRRYYSDSDYSDSDMDSEHVRRKEKRKQRKEKHKDRMRRRQAGEVVSSTTYYSSSLYSSDSYYDSSDSSYFDSSSFMDTDVSSATRRKRKKRRQRERKRERERRRRREAGIEDSDSYSYHSSDYSTSLDSIEGLDKEERIRRRKERKERRRREREEDMLLSPESRKRRRKERREEQREERRQRRRERLGLGSQDTSAAALMKEIGEIMEVVKYVRDAAGNIIATTLKGTKSAIRKLMRENLYYDDPLGEIYAVWDEDSIPDIEPFDDAPGYYNEAGEYIEYTPEERRRRREEHMAAVQEREILIAARQRKWEKMHEEEITRRMQSSLDKKRDKKGTSKKNRIHDAAMLKFRKQEERRREKEIFESLILEEYNSVINIWRDMDYANIADSLGQGYAASLKKAEIAREAEEKAINERAILLLQAQRKELLRRLRYTKQEFFLKSEVELSEIAELLYISRAFVFSYFNNVFGTRW